MNPTTRETLNWRGRLIEVSLDDSDYPGSFEHLEVRTLEPEGAPLPITETGYRSYYAPTGHVEDFGGAVAYVRLWLEQDAKGRKWAETEAAWRQLSLF